MNNSYIKLSEINEYFDNSLITEDWTTIIQNNQSKIYIYSAIDILDTKIGDYIGKKLHPLQQNEFPRDFTDYICSNTDYIDELRYWNRKIPAQVRKAIIEIISEIITTEDLRQLITIKERVNATSVGVSGINVSMIQGYKYFEKAKKLMSPFLSFDYSMRIA